ncbi:MAG: ATP-binding protein [Desulfotomaculales bacterium]
MCNWCVKHGDGGRWYLNTQNYAQKMYKIRQKEVKRKGAEANPQTMAEDLLREAMEARTVNPENFPMLKERAEQLSHAVHFGQVVTLQEVQAIMEIAYPIARMTCACRRQVRALKDSDNFFCMGLGVGMFKWERWPETYRGGVEFLGPQEAKEWLAEVNKKGAVHTFWTFGTPYIGGICNCEYPVCLGIRNRLDYDLKVLIKGHYVAVVDYSKCAGCGTCVERCQFGAVRLEVSLGRANVNMLRCFGCGLCETGCPHGAITMVERETIPLLANEW